MTATASVPTESRGPVATAAGLWDKVYSVVSAILLVLLAVQFFLAGLGIFSITSVLDNNGTAEQGVKNSEQFWTAHGINAVGLLVAMILLVVASFAARKPWRTTILTAALIVLLVIQMLIAHTGIAALSAVHVLNALLIVGLAIVMTRREWAFRRIA